MVDKEERPVDGVAVVLQTLDSTYIDAVVTDSLGAFMLNKECMNKIDKLDKELEKAREKAAEWQAKIRELEKQKQEEENSQIVQAVRSLKLTPAQLMAFLNDPKNSLTASGHTDPKPEAPEKEDTAHEEN